MELRQTATRSNSEVLPQSLIGVKGWLFRQWGLKVISPKLTVVLTDQYKQGEKLVQLFTNRQDGEALAMPYALIVPTNFAPRTEGFNRIALEKLGVHTGYVTGNRHERREKLVPVDVGLGVRFTCTDFQHGMMFAQIWAEKSPITVFDVIQQETGFRFKIRLRFDPNVDIPQDRNDNDTLDFLTTLIVETYVGSSEINKLITKFSLGFMDKQGWNGEYDERSNACEIRRVEHDGFKLENPQPMRHKLGLD